VTSKASAAPVVKRTVMASRSTFATTNGDPPEAVAPPPEPVKIARSWHRHLVRFPTSGKPCATRWLHVTAKGAWAGSSAARRFGSSIATATGARCLSVQGRSRPTIAERPARVALTGIAVPTTLRLVRTPSG
jgi:hypothetical protein